MTIKEFALLAGVSVSTVSKIMNGRMPASVPGPGHVLKLAKEYNLCPLCVCRCAHDPDADHGRDLSEY